MNDARANILVVDDAPDTREVVRRNLTARGYRVYTAEDVGGAIRLLESAAVDLVITDLKMPRLSGLNLVRHVRANYRDTEVMMMTGYATVTGAVEAVKTGAEEYLVKPFTDEELLAAVQRALGKLLARRARPTPSAPKAYDRFGLLGNSKPMRGVSRSIEKAAGTAATVLISGESGTGKELVARAIHYSSPRASAPFVPVNCGGIPEGLLETELFGYVKGAFTGAAESRAGFFQTADGGTIFLDEIAETSLAMQVKLLRVLQDGEVYMVGATRSRRVDVRILAATNKDLQALVAKDQFREDLFFRLSVITIPIPPLRERVDDIPLLVRHYAQKFAADQGRPTPGFSDNALEVLRSYYWPGNVRELENVIRRLVVMHEAETIDVPDLPSLMRYSAPRAAGELRKLADVEAEYIENVLASVGGNKTKAAEILGIDRKTLREKVKRGE